MTPLDYFVQDFGRAQSVEERKRVIGRWKRAVACTLRERDIVAKACIPPKNPTLVVSVDRLTGDCVLRYRGWWTRCLVDELVALDGYLAGL